jgi:gamma-glutamylcyclotransferase (GGCT)/AIG2-like uncharacterized protein YtfP
MKTMIEAPACPALFAYGTLMLPEVMRAVAGREFPGRPARLAGYARYRLHGKPYPGLRPLPDAVTDGVLYSGLDETAWRLLDQYEDDCYQRLPLLVELDGGRQVAADVYVIQAEFYPQLTAEPWSAEAFRLQHLASFLSNRGMENFSP